MQIYTYNFSHPTDTSIYREEEWDAFYDRFDIPYSRLRDEGRFCFRRTGEIWIGN
ncbi:hypothetical protein V1498_13060 [Peribacillus sp. SCS-26]|uniref:hypothetical protein n=1 Tax=Paraperibacillus marinus TaxID=3115295 RepID=UPI00390629ED